MSTFTMRVRASSRQYLTFWCPDSGGYVRLESPQKPGALGRQICKGGGFRGETLTADAESLPRVARAWRRDYLTAQRRSTGR